VDITLCTVNKYNKICWIGNVIWVIDLYKSGTAVHAMAFIQLSKVEPYYFEQITANSFITKPEPFLALKFFREETDLTCLQ